MKGSIKATCNVIILLMVGILCTGCGTAKEMSDANGQQVERAGEVAETSYNTEHLKDEVIDNSEFAREGQSVSAPSPLVDSSDVVKQDTKIIASAIRTILKKDE